MTTFDELRKQTIKEMKADEEPKDASKIANYQDSELETKQDSEKDSKVESKVDRQQDSEKESLLSIFQANQKALVQLNIRIPPGVNDWLDEEAHRRRREGVTKQGVVMEALREYIARRLAEE